MAASSSALNSELNDVARNTNDTAKAQRLVQMGADLSSTNGPTWRHTPLHQAAFHGRYEMAKALIELGAPLHLHSNPAGRGSTGIPLELARGGGHQAIADMIEAAMQGATKRETLSTMASTALNPPGQWRFMISYKQLEAKEAALKLAYDLTGKKDDVWLDVHSRDQSVDAMQEAVQNSDAFVRILTPSYFESEYCLNELKWALKSEKPIISCYPSDQNVGAILKSAPDAVASIRSIDFKKIDISNPAFFAASLEMILTSKGAVAGAAAGAARGVVTRVAKKGPSSRHIAGNQVAPAPQPQLMTRDALWDRKLHPNVGQRVGQNLICLTLFCAYPFILCPVHWLSAWGCADLVGMLTALVPKPLHHVPCCPTYICSPRSKNPLWCCAEPIGWAASHGQLHTVMALVGNGADPRAKNASGNNAFDDAKREKHTHVIQWLTAWEAAGKPTRPAPSQVSV